MNVDSFRTREQRAPIELFASLLQEECPAMTGDLAGSTGAGFTSNLQLQGYVETAEPRR
jgi:hypothetical protein